MRPFLTTQNIIERCLLAHGNKYDYSSVNYVNSKIKIKIYCKTCLNMFEQLPYNHYGAKKGCPKCYNIKSRKIQQLSLKDFIKKSIQIHENKYDYSLVNYINNRTKVKIKCNKCFIIFEQRPMQHMIGNGCPNCWHETYISKPETEFLNLLNIKTRQQNIGGYIVDGIKENIIYEFLGDFWHGNLSKYNSKEKNEILDKTFKILNNNTIKRFKNLINMGYEIKYIWESDWKNFIKNNIHIPNVLTFNGEKNIL